MDGDDEAAADLESTVTGKPAVVVGAGQMLRCVVTALVSPVSNEANVAGSY